MRQQSLKRKPNRRKRPSGIITQFARMWPRQLFEGPKNSEWAVDVSKDLNLPGVYVLYRDDRPYYVGQTKGRLYRRILSHANRPDTRYFNFWNFVSAFVVPDAKHVDQVEGLLITTMPTANRATPKIKRIRFPRKALKTATDAAGAKVLRRVISDVITEQLPKAKPAPRKTRKPVS